MQLWVDGLGLLALSQLRIRDWKIKLKTNEKRKNWDLTLDNENKRIEIWHLKAANQSIRSTTFESVGDKSWN